MVVPQTGTMARKYLQEIIPDVYQIAMGRINAILIVEEELTLIDTGIRGSSAQIADCIHRLGRSIEEINLIILTHNHLDHTGGLAELRKLTKAKVAAHKADFTDTAGQSPYPRVLRRLLRIPPFSALRSVFLVNSSEVDIKLNGDEVLKPLGGLRVIHTPGHTPGSISLYSPQNKLLIVGDAVTKHHGILRPPPKPANTDMTQAIDSIKRVARLDFDILCLGHGRPITRDTRIRMQELVEKLND